MSKQQKDISYDFKRKLFYETCDAINSYHVSILSGPRKCGKTVCLKQIENEYENAVYYNIKKQFKSESNSMDFIDQVVTDIQNNKDVLYLIDEATYIFRVDEEFAKIADAFTDNKNTKTRLVLSGSQSNALTQWSDSAFGGFAAYINADFISYPEWLAYMGISEVSEKSYSEFIYGTRTFYNEFSSVKNYLRACLNETVVSNTKPTFTPYNNDCSIFYGNVEPLLDILYASLLSLHNKEGYDKFFNKERLYGDLHYYFRNAFEEIGKEEIGIRFSEYLLGRYRNYQTLSAYQMQKALQFLVNCGLITMTYVTSNLNTNAYISQDIISDFSDLPKREIFERFNICIKHPFFYVELIKDILGDKMPQELPRAILGDVVERHIRGLLPTTSCIEYRDEQKREIDYVNFSEEVAIEISVGKKKNKDTHLNLLPDYKKISITREFDNEVNGIVRVPYYRFIAEHSIGYDLLKTTAMPSGGATGNDLTQTRKDRNEEDPFNR